eukprot:scaffold4840_cov115-Isochrysis_galbana.AAC.11
MSHLWLWYRCMRDSTLNAYYYAELNHDQDSAQALYPIGLSRFVIMSMSWHTTSACSTTKNMKMRLRPSSSNTSHSSLSWTDSEILKFEQQRACSVAKCCGQKQRLAVAH